MRLNFRSMWILGVVALMLLAGYLLPKLEGTDEPPVEIPASELTPATNTSILPGPGGGFSSATAGPSVVAELTKVATTSASAGGRDLSVDERQGGHTLARHVGKTDDELRARLRAEPDISAASTYTDRATAERVVAEVLERKKDELEKWVRRSGSRPNLALRLNVGEDIGRSVKQGETKAIDVESAVVVLRWTGNDWYVLTSYPEDR